MRPVLVDADVLVYWTAFACQKTRYLYEGQEFEDHKALREYLATMDLRPKEVEYDKRVDVLGDKEFNIICDKVVEMIETECKSTNLEFYISGDTNFREDIATLKVYKGNRTQDKPIKYEMAREYWLSRAFAVSDYEEADDLISKRMIELGLEGIIATIDKDLNMIPGRHFNWQKEKGKGRKYKVTPDQADRWFWTQMLTGDKADNIPGINRVGDKRAKTMLEDCETVEDRMEVVKTQYVKQYGDKWLEAMNEVGQLLWMRRKDDELWTYDTHQEISKL